VHNKNLRAKFFCLSHTVGAEDVLEIYHDQLLGCNYIWHVCFDGKSRFGCSSENQTFQTLGLIIQFSTKICVSFKNAFLLKQLNQ